MMLACATRGTRARPPPVAGPAPRPREPRAAANLLWPEVQASGGLWVGPGVSRRWGAGTEGPQAGPAETFAASRSPGSDGGEADRPALSGSTPVAVRVVDTAGGVPLVGGAVRPARVGVDGGTLSAALGADAAEARAAGLRAEPGRGPALAATGISRDPRKSQAGEGGNSLGR